MTKSAPEIVDAEIESLSHDGRGITRINGRVYFIDGVLPTEQVTLERLKKRRSAGIARLKSINTSSPQRIDPACQYFGTCGGCSLQHMHHDAQIQFKQQTLIDNLQRIGGINADIVLPPLMGKMWGYRRKARLGVRFVPKKGGVLVGFRERAKSYVTSLDVCHTLESRISDLLPGLHVLIENLSCSSQIPQIEVAAGDENVALIFRHLVALNSNDEQLLREFARQNTVQVFLQPGGLESVHPIFPSTPESLFYYISNFDISLQFEPTDFIQVNAEMNQRMVEHVVHELQVTREDSVVDLFCGLGNFTLPIATAAGSVIGYEGDDRLVNAARQNAEINDINNTEFHCLNLHDEQAISGMSHINCDKLLLDPPRSGAVEIVKGFVAATRPEKIVYVSCNPATLSRDGEILVEQLGYQLQSTRIVDMFPHTSHIESISVFNQSTS